MMDNKIKKSLIEDLKAQPLSRVETTKIKGGQSVQAILE